MKEDEEESTTVRLQFCLERYKKGDAKSLDEMIALAWRKLERLAAKMFKAYPKLRGSSQFEDALQDAMLRFWQTLKKITPETLTDFFHLAALQIRRTLIDLLRRHLGPLGIGTNETQSLNNPAQPQLEPRDGGISPEELIAWEEFHNTIGNLPPSLRQVFELLWYYQLPKSEVAQLLGLGIKKVRSRWQEARVLVYEQLDGHLPSE